MLQVTMWGPNLVLTSIILCRNERCAFYYKTTYGGKVTGDQYMSYEGGKVDHIDHCDADLMSMLEITKMLKELKYEDDTMIIII